MKRRHRLATPALLLVLVLLHLALFPYATLVTDSGRDLANAYAVAHGGPYPLYGPGLFGHWKLGPVWFWLLSLPLWVFGSITAAACFIGLLAAAKIPLAYLLGRRLLDQRLGLLAALIIALPGWSSVGTLVLAHASVVESAVLATLLLAVLAWQTRRPAAAVLACLMLALALHAHPTALLAGPVVALALWRLRQVPWRWLWLLLAALAFVLPFVPALLAEMRSGWPQLAASASYLQQMRLTTRLARLPQLLWALGTGGVWFVAGFLLPLAGAVLAWLLWGLLLAAALLGWVRLLLGRIAGAEQAGLSLGRIVLAALFGLAAVAFIALLRDATPVWMVYSLVPLGALALALGLHALLAGRQHAGRVVGLLVLATLLIDTALLQQRIALAEAGRVALPGKSIGDITATRAQEQHHSPWLAAWQFDELARASCAEPGRLALHGELATTFDFSQGVAAQLHCPESQLPRLGGQDADRHLVGLSHGLALELGVLPQPQRWGHVLREPRQVLAPQQGREARVDVEYRVDRQRPLDARGDVELSGNVQCAPGELLVVTNLMPLVNRFSLTVQRGAHELVPQARTMSASYFPCDGEAIHWRILTPDPASADVMVIARAAD
ncbi:MAG: hypothetical protein GX826_11620 [Gammaproteobacteria bacterium]|nr:hypothetical protein [Gammaproteobacteria bacterium]